MEKNETHYFYWPLEAGFTYITILGRKFPIFPIKKDDYEPIKTSEWKGKKIVLSRFHYDIFLYFNNLELENEKPIVDFLLGSHSPMVYVKKGSDITINNKVNWDDMEVEGLDFFQALYMMYKLILKGVIKKEICETIGYDVIHEELDSEIELEPSSMKALLIFGKYEEPEAIENTGYKLFS